MSPDRQSGSQRANARQMASIGSLNPCARSFSPQECVTQDRPAERDGSLRQVATRRSAPSMCDGGAHFSTAVSNPGIDSVKWPLFPGPPFREEYAAGQKEPDYRSTDQARSTGKAVELQSTRLSLSPPPLLSSAAAAPINLPKFRSPALSVHHGPSRTPQAPPLRTHAGNVSAQAFRGNSGLAAYHYGPGRPYAYPSNTVVDTDPFHHLQLSLQYPVTGFTVTVASSTQPFPPPGPTETMSGPSSHTNFISSSHPDCDRCSPVLLPAVVFTHPAEPTGAFARAFLHSHPRAHPPPQMAAGHTTTPQMPEDSRNRGLETWSPETPQSFKDAVSQQVYLSARPNRMRDLARASLTTHNLQELVSGISYMAGPSSRSQMELHPSYVTMRAVGTEIREHPLSLEPAFDNALPRVNIPTCSSRKQPEQRGQSSTEAGEEKPKAVVSVGIWGEAEIKQCEQLFQAFEDLAPIRGDQAERCNKFLKYELCVILRQDEWFQALLDHAIGRSDLLPLLEACRQVQQDYRAALRIYKDGVCPDMAYDPLTRLDNLSRVIDETISMTSNLPKWSAIRARLLDIMERLTCYADDLAVIQQDAKAQRSTYATKAKTRSSASNVNDRAKRRKESHTSRSITSEGRGLAEEVIRRSETADRQRVDNTIDRKTEGAVSSKTKKTVRFGRIDDDDPSDEGGAGKGIDHTLFWQASSHATAIRATDSGRASGRAAQPDCSLPRDTANPVRPSLGHNRSHDMLPFSSTGPAADSTRPSRTPVRPNQPVKAKAPAFIPTFEYSPCCSDLPWSPSFRCVGSSQLEDASDAEGGVSLQPEAGGVEVDRQGSGPSRRQAKPSESSGPGVEATNVSTIHVGGEVRPEASSVATRTDTAPAVRSQPELQQPSPEWTGGMLLLSLSDGPRSSDDETLRDSLEHVGEYPHQRWVLQATDERRESYSSSMLGGYISPSFLEAVARAPPPRTRQSRFENDADDDNRFNNDNDAESDDSFRTAYEDFLPRAVAFWWTTRSWWRRRIER